MREMEAQAKLPLKVKVCYAAGHFANMVLMLVNAVFLLYFYTDVIGISPAAAAVIIMIARIWDAVNDPMMGILVDKKKSKQGKCRFFLRWFSVPAGICFALSYFVPNLMGPAKIVWIAVTYILQGMGSTAVSVPLFTLMARLTNDQVERAKLGQYQSFSAIIANLLIPAVTLPFVKVVGQGNLRLGFQIVSIIYGAAIAIGYLATWWGTKGCEQQDELDEPQPQAVEAVEASAQKEKAGVRDILSALFHNKVCLLVAACYLMYCIYSTLMGSSLVYYLTYNLHNVNLMSAYSVLSTVTGFAPILLMVAMVKKMGNARTTMLACLIVVIGQCVRFISHDSFIGCLYFGWCMEGVGVALFGSMIRQCMIDSMVYGEWKTGVSNQAILMSILSFAQKAGQAVGGVGAAALLGVFGYVANAQEQSQTVLNVFFTENVTLPMITFLISIGLLSIVYKYEKKIPQMKEEIAERNILVPEGEQA